MTCPGSCACCDFSLRCLAHGCNRGYPEGRETDPESWILTSMRWAVRGSGPEPDGGG
jgi:hypothetical protein